MVLKDPPVLLKRRWGTGREGDKEKKKEMGMWGQVNEDEEQWRNRELIRMVIVNIPHSFQL